MRFSACCHSREERVSTQPCSGTVNPLTHGVQTGCTGALWPETLWPVASSPTASAHSPSKPLPSASARLATTSSGSNTLGDISPRSPYAWLHGTLVWCWSERGEQQCRMGRKGGSATVWICHFAEDNTRTRSHNVMRASKTDEQRPQHCMGHTHHHHPLYKCPRQHSKQEYPSREG